MSLRIPRRRFLLRSAGAIGAAAAAETLTRRPAVAAASPPDPASGSFAISLNTSTLRGHKLPLAEVIDIAARAGYSGIEPWHDEIARHLDSGGSLGDLRRRLDDHGLKVTGAIGFFEWMVEDEGRRRSGLEGAGQLMDRLAILGATHVAAPPLGATRELELLRIAERYHALLELGERTGVTPALEIWGAAERCSRLGEAVAVAIEAEHPKACVLPDVYHLHRGGSSLAGVRLLGPSILGGFHFNDYPADPPRDRIADRDRVYPGDGVAPLGQLLRDLRFIGYSGAISIELFNPTYYQQDPELVARTALEKMRRVIAESLAAAGNPRPDRNTVTAFAAECRCSEHRASDPAIELAGRGETGARHPGRFQG